MELRHVDPKTLLDNPNNPRRTKTDDAEDRRLAYSIKAAGLIHPPVVRALEDGTLMIVAGHRRKRASIKAGLKSIAVHVRDGDEKTDDLAALSENLVRLGMSDVDQWKAVTRLRTEKRMTDRAICQALMFTPAKLKQLELLANLHPPMLDAIERRLLPSVQQLAVIAAAPSEDQAFVWGRQFDADEDDYDPDYEDDDEDDSVDGEAEPVVAVDRPAEADEIDPRDRLWPDEPGTAPDWAGMAHALRRTRFFARDARFDDDQAKACHVLWTEDLFAEGGTDNRFTEDREAFEAAQRLWLDGAVGEGVEVLGADPYGSPELPEHCIQVWNWMAASETDRTGLYLDPRSLVIKEVMFRDQEPAYAGAARATGSLDVSASAAAKERPDLSSTGHALIGARRTEALHAALADARQASDPWTLVAALLLAFSGENVTVRRDSNAYYPKPEPAMRTQVARRIAPDGLALADPALLRDAAIDVLTKITSCASDGQEKSGDPALLLGVLFEADRHLPSFSDEDFLKTYSKGGITKTLQGEGLAPRNTGKEMRAAFVTHLEGARWIPDVARFEAVLPGWRAQITRAAESAALVEKDDEDADGCLVASEISSDDADEAEEGEVSEVTGGAGESASGAKETQDPIAAHVEAAAEQFREGFCRSDAERAHFDSHVTFVGVGA